MIDKEDYEKVSPFRWTLHANGPITFLPADAGAGAGGGKTFSLLLARLVMGVENTPESKVYHLTNNFLDCRKSNLSLTPRGYQLHVPGRWDKWFEHKEELDEYGFPRV